MLVCVCKAVSERQVRDAVDSGAETVEEVGAVCGAGTCCGSCRPAIAELLCEQPDRAAPRSLCARSRSWSPYLPDRPDSREAA